MRLRFALLCTLATMLAFLAFHPLYGLAQLSTNLATVTGIVQQSDGVPAAGATVQLIGATTLETQSDKSGTFVYTNVPYGTYRIVVTMKNLGVATHDHVVVTGDTVVTVRYEADATNGLRVIAQVNTTTPVQVSTQPVSVTTITPQTLADQGETTWQHVLNEIPGVNVGLTDGFQLGGVSNSRVENFSSLPGNPGQPQVLSLGGALSYESSVTMDGMPLATLSLASDCTAAGGGVDLGVYDPNAFSQYTVTIGPGAAAPSILSSVGGDLDLSPTSIVTTNRANISIANDPYGGVTSDATLDWHFGRFSAAVTYGLNASPGPLSPQSRNLSTFGYIAIDGHFFECNPNPPFYGSCWTSSAYNGVFDGYADNFGSTFSSLLAVNHQPLSTAWEQHRGSASLSYKISPAITTQVFYEGQRGITPQTPPSQYTFFSPGAGYAGPINPGAYFINGYTNDNGSQYSRLLEEKITSQLGRGQLMIAALQNITGAQCYYNDPENVSLQLFGGGYYYDSTTANYDIPVMFNGGTYDVAGASSSGTRTFYSYDRDASLSYSIPLGDRYRASVNYVQSYDSLGSNFTEMCEFSYPGGFYTSHVAETNSPEDFSTTEQLHFSLGGLIIRNLDVNASYYLASERYNGFLSVYSGLPPTLISKSYSKESFFDATPRLGIVYRPSEKIAIRASAGGSYTPPSCTNYVGYVGYISPNNPSAPTFYSESTSNPNLVPETAFGMSVGSDLKLNASTLLSLDLYQTNLWGQFYNTQNQDGTIKGLPFYINRTINLAATRYEGLSAQLRHDVPHGVFTQVQFGFTRGYIISLPTGFYNSPPTCTLCTNLTVFPKVNYTGFPYSQGYGLIGYRWSPQRYIDVSATYVGSNNSYYEPAFVVVNANAEYPLNKYLSLHATAENITGRYDRPIVSYSPFENPIIGEPQVGGNAAIWEPGLMYGPRTFLVRLDVHL